MPETETTQTVLQNEIKVVHENQEYNFKIPSVKDRLSIAALAAKLRKDNDPDKNGIMLGYDPAAVMLTDRLATFMVLLKTTSAPWVYSIDGQGHNVMDIDRWGDDVPVLEVIDQFNTELDKFRGQRA